METVQDNAEAGRYEILVDGVVGAFVDYRIEGGEIDLVHTETAEGHEGKGLAGRLVAGAVDDLRTRDLAVRPSCTYVQSWLKKHPEHLSLVPDPVRSELGLG